jgi:hypothetical protein
MAIQRHGVASDVGGDTPHRHRLRPLTITDPQRRIGDG